MIHGGPGRGSPDTGRGGTLGRILLYPFTGGAVPLVLATLAGAPPYVGVLGSIVAGAFAIPVVRASGRNSPDADSLPRLLPPPPGLVAELGLGLVLFLFYLGPWIGVLALAQLSLDVEIPAFVYSLLMLPLVLQVVLVIFLPAAIALLAIEGSPLSAFSRGRVTRAAGEMGAGYGLLVATMLLGGGPIFFLGDWLRGQGLLGRSLHALLVAWFWLLLLHLVGRVLRRRRPFDGPG